MRLIILIPRLENKQIHQLLTTESTNNDNEIKEKTIIIEFILEE